MNTYPTKLAEKFATQVFEIFYQMSVADEITNSDYEGEIRNQASKLNVLTFGAISEHAYTGADMTSDDLEESNSQLVTDQAKYIYFRIKDYDTFRSFVKNPEQPVQRQVANRIKKVIDIYVLGFYTDAGAGNWNGTDYTTGTVTIDSSGNVTGDGTTFTSAMEGRPFKALGHTGWYRVKTYSSATAIVIEDDSDDLTSAYTGGAIGAGATYTIQAVTAVTVTKDTIYAKMLALQKSLNNQEIPEDQRFLVLPTTIATLVKQSPEYLAIGTESGRRDSQNGKLPVRLAGFDLYEVSDSRVSGDETNGFYCLAGHKSAICFAMGLTENGVEDAIGNFGKKIKQLYVYGAKVADERRKALAVGYWKA